MMRFSLLVLVFITVNCTPKKENPAKSVELFYLNRLEKLELSLKVIANSNNIDSCATYFINARNIFKEIEPILAFTDAIIYEYLNGPNLLKIEEEDLTNIKFQNPIGFQVLEENLYLNKDLNQAKKEAETLINRLKLIKNNVRLEPFEPYHFLWLVRDQLIRVATLGISNMDSPVLKRHLKESALTLTTLKSLFTFYENSFRDKSLIEKWNLNLSRAILALKQADPESFDYFNYHKNINESFLKLWHKTTLDWQAEFPFDLAIKNSAKSLYSDSTFNKLYFSKKTKLQNEKDIIGLGEKLFFEKLLSKNGKTSCGTCHVKTDYFTDRLKFPFKGSRNTPTLTYAVYQNKFFYDGSSGSLDGQIISVIKNPNEFHSSLSLYFNNLEKIDYYKKAFKNIYQKPINDLDIRDALATYVASLGKFDSKFDKNIRAEENSLSLSEKKGFNIFMGKAKCGNCHFSPVFNGTVPPLFSETELEHLGVPNAPNGNKIDTDLGRFYVFNTKERKYFFKTPTLRNIEKTAPYMHNGSFKTLEEVLDFYNKGGGNGMGFNEHFQTLPSEPLNLSDADKTDLINFLKTLTDTF